MFLHQTEALRLSKIHAKEMDACFEVSGVLQKIFHRQRMLPLSDNYFTYPLVVKYSLLHSTYRSNSGLQECCTTVQFKCMHYKNIGHTLVFVTFF